MARERFLLVGNSTYMNHGSEAIVRGTVIILREFFDRPEIVSAELALFPYDGISETDAGIIHEPVFMPKRHSVEWFFNQAQKAILTRPVFNKRFARRMLLPEIKKADAVLSLGGDNYIKRPFFHIAQTDLAEDLKIPAILWCASVGPFTGSARYQKSVFNHLRNLSGIFVRETVSQQYLADNGVKDNVYLVEDPAFLMEPEMPDGELVENLSRNAIGISLSNLFLSHTRFSENHEDAVYRIVEAVRQRFGRPIILVPHCVQNRHDDHALLDGVLKNNARRWTDVKCLPKLWTAAQIKWAISKLHAFVGARAHATIAAFSTYVPTVSLVYSFKGEGFNHRLFNCLDYVVKKEQCEPEIIVEKLELVLDNHDEIRKTLQGKMIEAKKGAMRAGHLLKKIISDSSLLGR